MKYEQNHQGRMGASRKDERLPVWEYWTVWEKRLSCLEKQEMDLGPKHKGLKHGSSRVSHQVYLSTKAKIAAMEVPVFPKQEPQILNF